MDRQQPNLIKPAPSGARSARIHELLLKVTGQLLDEGGLPAATVDAIAARSGVSKMTIYNHWPSRIAIAASAFARLMGAAVPVPDVCCIPPVRAHRPEVLGALAGSRPSRAGVSSPRECGGRPKPSVRGIWSLP